ncbi:MAG TPA: hypothetical protein PKE45_16220 [Caldilineaceae bacterium]|nr:hypothetical protein [Caldilineaceae bacterium]
MVCISGRGPLWWGWRVDTPLDDTNEADDLDSTEEIDPTSAPEGAGDGEENHRILLPVVGG